MSRFTIQALCILACLLSNAALAFTTSKAAISSSQQQRAASSLSAATLPMLDNTNTNTKGLWELQLYDDSENYDFYVEKCLIKLAGLSTWQAYKAMKTASLFGKATFGLYTYEKAKSYKDALRCNGLVVDTSPLKAQL